MNSGVKMRKTFVSTRRRANVKKWCPLVVSLICLGLFGTSQAAPPVVVSQAGNVDNGERDIQMMRETLVEGSLVDPFDAEKESELVRDPWESFNANMFAFNYRVDRYFFKPTSRVYNAVVPTEVQNSLGRAINQIGFAPRLVNNLLQGKFTEAGIETQRFLINATLGVGGLFDVATHMFEIEAPPTEDTGQTLAVYGVETGPYLVLPLFPPMTVRDAAGTAGDIFMNPVNYVIPFFPNLGVNGMDRINDRSLSLEQFEELEASTLDLYGAARSAYFERRAQDVRK